MSVLGEPEPAPAGLWEAALGHALTATADDALGLLVPDLWTEPALPEAGDDGFDLGDVSEDDGDPAAGADVYEPWQLDDDPGDGRDPAADGHDDGADGGGPWPTS